MNDNKIEWVVHYVQEHHCDICGKHEEKSSGFSAFANVHTHGLNLFNHPELCITIDIGPEIIMPVLNTLGLRIKHGESFSPGIYDDALANGYKAKFIKFDNEDILYLILPDSQNRFPEDSGCEFPYNKQLFYAEIIHNDKE